MHQVQDLVRNEKYCYETKNDINLRGNNALMSCFEALRRDKTKVYENFFFFFFARVSNYKYESILKSFCLAWVYKSETGMKTRSLKYHFSFIFVR